MERSGTIRNVFTDRREVIAVLLRQAFIQQAD